MASKFIAVALVVMAGGIAAYDINYFIDRKSARAPAGDGSVGETPVGETPVGETPVGETPVGETPVGETPVGEPAVEESEGQAPPGDTAPAGKPDAAPAAEASNSDLPASVAKTLPPVFQLEWVNPFGEAKRSIPAEGSANTPQASSDSAPAPSAAAFQTMREPGTEPVVSAVLIGTGRKSAIISGQVVTEGAKFGDATVVSIQAEGVQMKAGGETRFYHVSVPPGGRGGGQNAYDSR